MATSSTIGSFARFAAHRLRVAMGLGSDGVVERPRVVAERLRVSPERLNRYLRATEVRNGDLDSALRLNDEGGGVGAYGGATPMLPPLFPSVWETALLLDLLRLGGFSFPRAGIVHVGGERVYLRRARASDELRLSLELERAVHTRRGLSVVVRSELSGVSGRTFTTGKTEILLRGVEESRGEEEVRRTWSSSDRVPEEQLEWQELARWRVGAGAGRRYALASGDFNPIHLSRPTARVFGFTRPILHGFCIEAMIADALIEQALGGDGGALRRMAIRFARPLLLPGDAVLWTACRSPGGSACYRLTAPDLGGKPFAEGSYLGAMPGARSGK